MGLFVGVIAVSAMLGYWLTEPRPQPVTVIRCGEGFPPRDTGELSFDLLRDGRTAKGPDERPAVTAAAAGPDSGADLPSELSVSVTYEGTGEPATGFVVHAALAASDDDDPDIVEATTNDTGGCRIPLSPHHLQAIVDVRAPTGNAIIANWIGDVVPEIRIQIPPLQFLYLQVVAGPNSDVVDSAESSVTVYAARSSTGSGRFLGAYGVPPDGKLALMTHLSPELEYVKTRVFVTDQLVASMELPIARLRTAPGPAIVLDLKAVDVTVTDESGAPVAGADVRATCEEASETRVVRGRTNAEGRSSVILSGGGAELRVGAAGFRTWAQWVPTTARSLAVKLDRVDPDDVLRVAVYDDIGTPLADALVTVYPATGPQEQALAARLQSRTNASGDAQIVRNFDGPGYVVAAHKVLGATAPEPFHSSAGARIELFMESVCELELIPLFNGERLGAREGEELWCVCQTDRRRSWDGSTSGLTRIVDQIPLGEHLVGVYATGAGLFGFATVTCGASTRIPVEIELRPARFAEGMVRMADAPDGSWWELAAEPESIPPPIAAKWCRTTVRENGMFRVMCGDSRFTRFSLWVGRDRRFSTDERDTIAPLLIEMP